MKSPLLFSTAIILSLVYVLSGCDTLDDNRVNVDVYASADFSYEVPVANQTMVRLEGINGSVDAHGVPGATTVVVTGTRRVGSDSQSDAEFYLSRVTVEIDKSLDAIVIQTKQPDNSHGREYIVDYTITMPADLAIEVGHINGGVAVHDVMAGTAVHLINGTIFCSGQAPSEGPISLNAINGVIELEIPAGASAELHASVTNGNIRTSNLTLSNPVITSRSLTGKLGDGEIDIMLSTVNGDIVVRGL